MASFNDLYARLSSVHRLADPADLWERVAEARFNLARQGVQAHLVDLTIAITASVHGHALLTRDRDFEAIARVVPVDLDQF
jgi:predicted nucleic acid-binding protein